MKIFKYLILVTLFFNPLNLSWSSELYVDRCPDSLGTSNYMRKWVRTYDVIILSEIHGSNEFPQAFWELICQASRYDIAITAGIEIPNESLKSAADISLSERAKLDKSIFWREAKDGRSSDAYFDLISKIDWLSKSKSIFPVGFDNRVTGKENFSVTSYEVIQARSDAAAKKYRSHRNLIFLLTGGGHLHSSDPRNDISLPFIGSGKHVLILNGISHGGEAWNCVDGVCSLHSIGGDKNCVNPHIVALNDARTNSAPNELLLCVGTLTASRPFFK